MTDAASHSEQRRRATLVGAGAVILWGSLAILTTLTGEIQTFQIVATAFFVAFLLALIKWIIRGESLTAPFRQTSLAWAVGVGGLFGYHFLIFLALKISPPVQANLINYLWPLMIVLFSALLPGQTLRPPLPRTPLLLQQKSHRPHSVLRLLHDSLTGQRNPGQAGRTRVTPSRVNRRGVSRYRKAHDVQAPPGFRQARTPRAPTGHSGASPSGAWG